VVGLGVRRRWRSVGAAAARRRGADARRGDEGVPRALADRAAPVPRGADLAPQRRARPRLRRERAAAVRRAVPVRRARAREGAAMKLRGRFTLTLALAALVPISVAAVVTREVIASSYRADYEGNRDSARATVQRELET